MASNPVLDPRVADAVNAAMSALMRVRTWGDVCYVSMPLFYPNGTQIAVKVEPSQTGFRVSDGGLTYRELEQIGAENYFGRNAANYAREIDAFVLNHSVCLDIEPEELSAAIADMADMTARMANKVIARVAGKGGEAEIADHLYERLKVVFGEGKVERDAKLTGPSTRSWDIDAIVHLDAGDAIFQAVSKHYNSVYTTSAMFRDLALKDVPPVTTAVVRSKSELGSLYNILAQAENVIEEEQADAVYKRAVQWPA